MVAVEVNRKRAEKYAKGQWRAWHAIARISQEHGGEPGGNWTSSRCLTPPYTGALGARPQTSDPFKSVLLTFLECPLCRDGCQEAGGQNGTVSSPSLGNSPPGGWGPRADQYVCCFAWPCSCARAVLAFLPTKDPVGRCHPCWRCTL